MWSDVARAWSAENWPYTLAFWVILGIVMFILNEKLNPDDE